MRRLGRFTYTDYSLVGVLAYHFQIYFDFCGYSDMAVGLGRMFGFEFIKNFNAPYPFNQHYRFLATMAYLTFNWIMDYLYIPLGETVKEK